MKIKAVIFDMDGVLVDATEWHYQALNKALAQYGYHINHTEHLSLYNGLTTRNKLALLSQTKGLPRDSHESIYKLKQQYTIEAIETGCRPFMPHKEALSSLKALGYKLGLASNSIRNTVELIMQKCELAPMLDCMLSNQDVENAKPAPDIYLKAAELINVAPAECLVLEDNEHGIEAAERAGMHVLVIKDIKEVTFDNIMAAIRNIELTY